MNALELKLEQIVLLNIDMQHFFVEGAPSGVAVLQRVNKLILACHDNDVPVVHTAHTLRLKIPNLDEAKALHRDLAVRPNDIIFPKRHFGAFHDSDLETILRAKGIDTIIISGIRTNVCCEVTAWEAISRGFRVFFLSDGTATKEMDGVAPSVLQQATCATLNHLFGNVVTVDEMIETLEHLKDI